MIPVYRRPRRRILERLAIRPLVAICLLTPPAAAQETAGWISVLRPRGWSGEVTRGIGVKLRHSIRVEGLAYQPGGVGRVLIDGRPTQLERRSGGQVRFVGYAETDTVPRQVEITVYSRGPDPPVIREYEYRPEAAPANPAQPDEAWGVGRDFDGKRYAVVIGISEYADPAIRSLRYADDDAEAFYRFLTSDGAGLGGFDPEDIRFLVDEAADTRSVRTALTTFLRQATERDVVIIYLAGHGAADPFRPEDYYLLTHDSEASNFPGTAISMDDIDQYVRRLRARDIIVFTDACHSAAVSGGRVGLRDEGANEINRVFLEQLTATAAGLLTFTASETNQYSQEGPQWGGGHGVFTYELLRGLQGLADADEDGIVTLGEVVEHTRLAVQRRTGNAQVPFVGSGSFDRSWPIAIASRSALADAEEVFLTPEPVEAEPPGPTPPVTPGSAAARVSLMSPTGTFVQSLLLPGTGQLRTHRPWRGMLVLTGAIAASTYGVVTTRVIKRCREATVGGVCLSGQFTDSRTERPRLVTGLAIASALSLIGAIDAMLGARAINDERLRAVGREPAGKAALKLLPTDLPTPYRSGDLVLLQLRFR
jgi:Caspase domain